MLWCGVSAPRCATFIHKVQREMKKNMCGTLILNGNINSMLLDNNDNNDDDGVVWFISQHLAATQPDRPTDQLTDRRAYISNAIGPVAAGNIALCFIF